MKSFRQSFWSWQTGMPRCLRLWRRRISFLQKRQRTEKEQVMESRLTAASLVPMEMMEKAMRVLDILELLEEKGSIMAVSDVGVAVQFARAALNGAVMNVYINTKSMKNRARAEELNQKAEDMIQTGAKRADEIYERVRVRLCKQSHG